MPNIKTYENQVEAPRATGMGSEAFETEGRHTEASYAQAGNAIGGLIKGVGNKIEEHEEIQDTSAISAQGAKAFSDLSQNLRTTMANSDPNQADATAQKWRDETLESAMNRIGADANTTKGRQMAERVQNTLREEFTRQSIGASSTLAGQAVIQNLTETKNGLAQAVSNDPSLLPTALAYLHGATTDQLSAHASLDAEVVARVHSEFTTQAAKDMGVAAFQTMAQRNPGAAKDALTGGTFAGLFSGEEIGTLNRYADAQGKAAIEAQKAAGVEQRRSEDEQYKGATASVYASMLKPDGSLVVPQGLPQEIVKLSLLPGAQRAPGEVRSMIDMVKSVNKENAEGKKAVTDPHTYESFNQRMLEGSLTDRDVYAARASGQLSDKDTGYFKSGIHDLAADPVRKDADKQFNAFLASQKSAFTHTNLLTGPDPRGAQNFFQFSQAARAQFDAAYKGGTWQQSLNANNPNFIGKIAPTYMSNKKGASMQSAPHFTSDAEADKGIIGLQKGAPFYGPDGQIHYKN